MSYREPGYYGPNDPPPQEDRYFKIGCIAALVLFVAVTVGTCVTEDGSDADANGSAGGQIRVGVFDVIY